MTQPEAPRSPIGLQLIGGFKVACALLLMALGFGLFRDIGGNLGDEAEHLVSLIKLDKDNDFIHSIIEKISGLSPGQLRAIAVGTFLYALLYLVEGTGLLLKKHWAEYLTVIATGLFIPVEIWEVFRRPTLVRFTILALNVAILVYVVVAMLRQKRAKTAAAA